jgi:protein AbiQ
MDEQLLFYEVSADYISFILRVDPKIPKVDYSATSKYDKFLCGIVLKVNNYNYFAPISSFKTPQRTNIIIQNEEGKSLSSIRFSFMIPVPLCAITVKDFSKESSPYYRRLLDWELKYCQKNEKAIYRKAKYVYNTVVSNRDPIMVKNCCNFTALEVACDEYTKPMLMASKGSAATETIMTYDTWELLAEAEAKGISKGMTRGKAEGAETLLRAMIQAKVSKTQLWIAASNAGIPKERYEQIVKEMAAKPPAKKPKQQEH